MLLYQRPMEQKSTNSQANLFIFQIMVYAKSSPFEIQALITFIKLFSGVHLSHYQINRLHLNAFKNDFYRD